MQAAGYRQLNVRIWNDEKFSQFSPTDKLICIYLLTGPQTSRVGCFNFSVGLASDDLSIPPETVRPAVRRICEALGWSHDEKHRVLYLVASWWKYNRKPSGTKQIEGYRKDFELLPNCSLKSHAMRAYQEILAGAKPTAERPRSDREATARQPRAESDSTASQPQLSANPEGTTASEYAIDRNRKTDRYTETETETDTFTPLPPEGEVSAAQPLTEDQLTAVRTVYGRPIGTEDQKRIAKRLAEGVPLQQIVDAVRGRAGRDTIRQIVRSPEAVREAASYVNGSHARGDALSRIQMQRERIRMALVKRGIRDLAEQERLIEAELAARASK